VARESVAAAPASPRVKPLTGGAATERVPERPGPLHGAELPLPGGAPLEGPDLDYVLTQLAEAEVPPPPLPLRPVLETAYRRTTLLIGSEGSRVTLDSALTWRGSGLQPYRLADLFIVETKSSANAGAADRFLWRAHHRPQRISKFATGMALLAPTLPTNRWH